MPRKWGGLGIRNLEIQNISLLLRWWWRLYQQNESVEVLGIKAAGACKQRRGSHCVVEKRVVLLGSITQFKESVSFKHKVEYRGCQLYFLLV